ncbi:MAG: hypothetical protein HN392_01890 [Anaerolineae bacterium]|jgi:hypothetical protein|nr:hypothetical protein [Anaerolineae bacterium]MBT7075326.1 hypothetical protein [Anaerolineae bacterium]MBT7783915.1 hypothetical protein [Anaerolineae bacterium]
MDIINCPVCGEENPVSLEKCQHCNQLLRQSTSELNGVGKLIDSGQSPTAKKTSELESALPAWLKNARQGGSQSSEPEEKEEESAPVPPPPPAEEEKPEAIIEEDDDDDEAPLDWLAGLDDDEEDEDEAEAADWLVNLQGDTTVPEKEEEVELPGTPATDEPITAGDFPIASTKEDTPINTGELPDWISDLQEKDSEQETEALPNLFEEEKTEDTDDIKTGVLPDWLSTLSEQADSSPPAETPAVQPLSGIEADDLTESIDEDEPLPDWMTDLETSDSAEETPPTTENNADLPDWMSNLQETESTPEETTSTAEDTNALADWMTSSEDETPAVEEKAPEEISSSLDEDTPDWLSRLQVDDTASQEAPSEKESNADAPALDDTFSDSKDSATASVDSIADWMIDPDTGEDPADKNVDEIQAEATLSKSDDLPDWMADLKPTETPVEEVEDISAQDSVAEREASSQTSDPFALSAEDANEEDIAPAAKGDVPDWLSSIEKFTNETDEVDAVEEEVEKPPPSSTNEEPDWLDNLSTIDANTDVVSPSPSVNAAFVEEDDDVSDEVFGIEMPDWLSSLSPDDVDEEEMAEVEADGGDGGASGAELPSWVQAMRPVADVVPDSSKSSDENIVGTGPLAGLSGVLPAVSAMEQIGKPKAHSIKLNVSDSQQANAALLEEVLASEAEVHPFLAPAKTSSIPVLRWVIALLLILVLGFSLQSQSTMVPSPNMEIPEIRNAVNLVEQLPTGGSALLVFDYEAAFSGEMKTIASPLITQLMSRGQNLVVLSTSPTGSALAENLFEEIRLKSDYEIISGANYQSLGYLPGGSSGISNFISSPRQTIGNTAFWERESLKEIAALSDFSIVIILTNDTEKGRNWIEQKTLYLENNEENMPPFLMAISAQAEPIIYPYYASGQIDALISGLSGSATYEAMQGQEGLGRKYWDAYSVGLLFAEILIAIGAMINFLVAIRAKQKKQEEGK